MYELIQAEINNTQLQLKTIQLLDQPQHTLEFELQIKMQTLRFCADLAREHKKHEQALELMLLQRGIV